MGIFKESTEVEVRERRLHSTLSYQGDAYDLHEKSKRKELGCKVRYYGQCGDCAEGCAETITYHVIGSAVVSHAPVGCSVNVSNHHILGRAVSSARGLPMHKVHMISSNIQEKDTVYGAAEKLKTAIYEADKRFKPKLIFIQASCASGIIGEDLESIASETEEELGYPIVPVYCEGFKSKIWSTGFDAAFHGILRRMIKEPKQKQKDLVNIFNFEGSDLFIPFLKKLNLRVNYLIPLATIEQIETLTEAACTAHICETLATYIASALEEKYGIPEVKVPPPFGIDWTDEWLREIARFTDREALAEQVIKAEHAKIAPELKELREKLKGKKVYVLSGDSFAHNIANIAKDLGLALAGVNTLHHDLHTDNPLQANTLEALIQSNGNIENFTVCNKQPYQMIKILKRIQPDLLIVRHMNLTSLGTKLGIPTLFEGDANYSIGYDGVVKMGRRFYEALQTKKLVETIAAHTKLPYSDWWLSQEDPFYFERGEKL
ncbi:nitrogenase component 1 [Anaerosinus massiliensis]|uniref:nitrogenase component 1 n=1 Tax=Massilibacillus massiliensis TaxID=1806837 RepID=UPI000DA60BA0|nr:nitrogenase component 1 [Massilibacillus massiliensis]